MSARPNGFTLLEVLLVVAIMAVILSASVPVYRTLVVRNDAELTASLVAQTMRRAQILSQGQNGDQTWGVHISGGIMTLFRGASFAVRDVAWDEEIILPKSVSTSGLADVVFAKLTGLPDEVGTVTITGDGAVSKTVVVSAGGLVSN